ncbi:MAG: sensor histidine kinase [Chitinophagales bacterium]|nr:sensor histidine kinase [Chitinophagales bacterium]
MPKLLGESLNIYVDSAGTKSFDEVRTADLFQPSVSEVPNLGVAQYAVWIKMIVSNESNYRNFLLEIENPLLEKVTFYAPGDDGYEAKEINKDQPFRERGNTSQNFQFDMPAVSSEPTVFYLRVESNTQLLIPVKIGSPVKVANADLNKDMLSGLYFGIMLVMLLYNMFVYFSTKDRSYLYYILYIFSVALVQLNITGLGFKYLWPQHYSFEKYSLYLFPSFTAFASIAFIRSFLHTKRFAPRLHIGFWVFVIAYVVTMINAFVGDKHLSYNLLNFNALPLSLYMIGTAAYIRVKHKYRPALFFLVAWTVFLLSVMVFVVKDLGVLPYNLFTVSIIQIGSAFVVVLLSIALADSINILRKEKEESQSQALAALEENARIIREQNVILETKVNERTQELSQSNAELNKTLHDLKEAEMHLVESEKMASLGQLTAGIAHEINNPINFVTSNVKPLKRDIEMIIEMLGRVEEITVDAALPHDDKKRQIDELKEEMDYDYLKEEIEYLLKGITEGSNRTAEIVKGLRVFSRLDEDDLKIADINEGIDSTLVIVRNTLGSNIDIVKEYGNIPTIECYPGKLNQVFLNIITNGLQAITSRFKGEKGGVMTISTFYKDDQVVINIKDNGIGMDENTKKKVFEPFFTTKEVGEGTGLGMSIVYNTINKHNGKIELESVLGEGTEFVISLPAKHVTVQTQENIG